MGTVDVWWLDEDWWELFESLSASAGAIVSSEGERERVVGLCSGWMRTSGDCLRASRDFRLVGAG